MPASRIHDSNEIGGGAVLGRKEDPRQIAPASRRSPPSWLIRPTISSPSAAGLGPLLATSVLLMLFLSSAAPFPARADRYVQCRRLRRKPRHLTGSSLNSPDQPARQEIRRQFGRLTALRDLTIA